MPGISEINHVLHTPLPPQLFFFAEVGGEGKSLVTVGLPFGGGLLGLKKGLFCMNGIWAVMHLQPLRRFLQSDPTAGVEH